MKPFVERRRAQGNYSGAVAVVSFAPGCPSSSAASQQARSHLEWTTVSVVPQAYKIGYFRCRTSRSVVDCSRHWTTQHHICAHAPHPETGYPLRRRAVELDLANSDLTVPESSVKHQSFAWYLIHLRVLPFAASCPASRALELAAMPSSTSHDHERRDLDISAKTSIRASASAGPQ